jgi:hypothetical protein
METNSPSAATQTAPSYSLWALALYMTKPLVKS